MLAILIRPDEKTPEQDHPDVSVRLNGKQVEPRVEEQKGSWGWYQVAVDPGPHRVRVAVEPAAPGWRGRASAWLLWFEAPAGVEVAFELVR